MWPYKNPSTSSVSHVGLVINYTLT